MGRTRTKWARYEVRRVASHARACSAIQLHTASAQHRLACEVFTKPETHLSLGKPREEDGTACSVRSGVSEKGVASVCGRVEGAVKWGSGACETTACISEPFRGRVPQVKDWVDAWADSTSCVSFRKQQRLQRKRHELCLRRQRRKQVAVMAEVAREETRKRVREAESITLAIDGCKARKIIRIRCDTPGPPYIYDGVIGALRLSYEEASPNVAQEITEDHAAHALTVLKNALRRFCTPLRSRLKSARGDSSGFLEDLWQKFVQCVRILAADGDKGERRTLFLACRELFPNVAALLRDPAHIIRISTQKPLQLEDLYGEVFSELVGKRHALIPDIQNSFKWQRQLVAIQTQVLRIPCLTREAALQIVLRHLALAKQRMDSCADPIAKFCLMLMPIALLLSFKSSDERTPSECRERAAALLAKFQPKFLLAAGASADWGLICNAFLRLFDRLQHDISNSLDELEEFVATIRAVFIEGGLFCPVSKPLADAGQPVATPAQKEGTFITDRVRRQMRHKCVFHCGNKQQVVWGQCSGTDLKDLSQRTRVAAQAMLDRIDAEFAGIRRSFSCFRLERVEKAFVLKEPGMRATVRKHLGNLARAFKVDGALAALELQDAAPVAVRFWKAAVAACGAKNNGESFDNRTIFCKFLDVRFIEEHFPARAAPFTALPKLIRNWISVLDGEAQVERDLGTMRAFLEEHAGNMDDSTVDDLVVLQLDGPLEPGEVATPAGGGGGLAATKFTTKCAELWRRIHGQRFSLYSGGSAPGKKVQKPRVQNTTTFIEVRRAVLRAARCVRAAPRNPQETTKYGVPVSFFRTPSNDTPKQDTPFWNQGLGRFAKLTALKRVTNAQSVFGKRSFPKIVLKPSQPMKLLPRPAINRIVFLPESARANADGYKVLLGAHCCRAAHLVIVDSWECFHQPVADADFMTHALYIIALGVPVTTTTSWQHVGGRAEALHFKDVVHHLPLIRRRPIEFKIDRSFKVKFPELLAAFKDCVAQESSQWTIVKHFSSPPPKKTQQMTISDAVNMWQWLQGARAVANQRGAAMVWRADGKSRW